jgi:hypothetical protein
MNKQITKDFKSTKEALDLIESLRKDKINGNLNSSINKDKTYTWLVTYNKKGK